MNSIDDRLRQLADKVGELPQEGTIDAAEILPVVGEAVLLIGDIIQHWSAAVTSTADLAAVNKQLAAENTLLVLDAVWNKDRVKPATA